MAEAGLIAMQIAELIDSACIVACALLVTCLAVCALKFVMRKS